MDNNSIYLSKTDRERRRGAKGADDSDSPVVGKVKPPTPKEKAAMLAARKAATADIEFAPKGEGTRSRPPRT